MVQGGTFGQVDPRKYLIDRPTEGSSIGAAGAVALCYARYRLQMALKTICIVCRLQLAIALSSMWMDTEKPLYRFTAFSLHFELC